MNCFLYGYLVTDFSTFLNLIISFIISTHYCQNKIKKTKKIKKKLFHSNTGLRQDVMKSLLMTVTLMWAVSWELFTTFLLVRFVLILCYTIKAAEWDHFGTERC